VASLDGLLPELQPYAHYLVSLFPRLLVTSVYRSRTAQLELYRNRAKNPYPVAPPGLSYHEYRRAWDMVGPPEDLARAGQIWESWGGTWGGRFRNLDPIHFQV
jgi:hypothetical protein